MEATVYIDVLFLVNFVFDYLLLWLTGLILHIRAKTGQLLLATLPGALYATLMFFLPLPLFYSLPFKIGVGALMVLVAFRPASLGAFLKEVCVFYTVTMMFGGAAFTFFYFSDLASLFGAVYKSGTLYLHIPIYLLLFLALCCYLVLKAAFACGAKLAARGKEIICLQIGYKDKELHLRAFYDSGNLLREEISGKGVIVAEWRQAKHLFPGRKTPEEAEGDGLIPIPYRTLQGTALLYAFLPDRIYIEERSKLIPTETVYIGLIDQTLDYYHNWDAILPHDFKGENDHETKLYPKNVDNISAPEAKNYKMASR